MRVVLRSVAGCPNARVAEERLREALGMLGLSAAIAHEIVASLDEATALGFAGSPTLLIGGRDPFAREGDAAGLACRIYRTEAGLQGAPSVSQIIEALRAGGCAAR